MLVSCSHSLRSSTFLRTTCVLISGMPGSFRLGPTVGWGMVQSDVIAGAVCHDGCHEKAGWRWRLRNTHPVGQAVRRLHDEPGSLRRLREDSEGCMKVAGWLGVQPWVWIER